MPNHAKKQTKKAAHDIWNARICGDVVEQRFEAGDVVFREGDYGDHAYVVIDGNLVTSCMMLAVDAVGKNLLLRFEERRVLLRCHACGNQSPGWNVGDRQPKLRFTGDASQSVGHIDGREESWRTAAVSSADGSVSGSSSKGWTRATR
jgi:hypothetical protein